MDIQEAIKLCDEVEKTGGDYTFRGTVVAVFTKKSGAVRVVVENRDGLVHIFNPKQLTKVPFTGKTLGG